MDTQRGRKRDERHKRDTQDSEMGTHKRDRYKESYRWVHTGGGYTEAEVHIQARTRDRVRARHRDTRT